MKKLIFRLFIFILVFSLLSGAVNVLAAEAITVFDGHWAAETLNRALGDALISGNPSDIHPDDAITGAQLVTILCRVFSADKAADISQVPDISKSDWYYTAASQAVAMGIISLQSGRVNLASPITRARAFAALADAFQLVGAAPDTSQLAQFTDSASLFGKYRTAAAALTSAGYVKGDGSLLHSDNTISLAEFLTILYRIVPNYHHSGQTGSTASGGAVVSNASSVSWKKFSDTVYFDCATTNISLQSFETPCAVVRSGILGTFNVFSCKIGRLVIAAGSGDMTFSPDFFSSIDTVVIGDGGGSVALSGTIPKVEVTGSRRQVIISGSVQNLLISGDGCNVTINPGASVGTVRILGPGAGNRLTVGGICTECDVYGAGATVSGTGSIQNLADNAAGSTITVTASKMTANHNYGLAGAALTLSAPDTLPFYQSLEATVGITAPDNGNSCKGLWYIDGILTSTADVTLGKTSSASLKYDAKNTSTAPMTATLSFILYFDDQAGGYQELRAEKNIVLESAGKYDANDIMTLVTTGYKGDFTLKWAQAHDYDNELKSAWVNLKGYASKTDYLVWVSIANQRTYIFSGSAGNWKLEKTFLVGTGAPGKDTPVGVFKVIGRTPSGWTTKTYTVKPVVNFGSGSYSAYGFHSRLYLPGTTTIEDPRIGFPISHGCVRMMDEDIAWFYQAIPNGTTVVIY